VGVTLWTTCFGTYGRFLDGWQDAALQAGADEVLVVSDVPRPVSDGVRLLVASTPFQYQEAGLRNVACEHASEDWLWQIDVDDRILPGAASMVEGQTAGVVQVGYIRSDGFEYVPRALRADVYLNCEGNPYVSGSPFTREAYLLSGGFPDVAWSDWGLWRRMARAGVAVAAAGRVAYLYRWEPHDSVTGLYGDPRHVAEVLAL
jgi:hypothetical protein